MKSIARALVVVLSVFCIFNLTIGRLMTDKVRQFEQTLIHQPPTAGSGPIAVDSSVCALLADRGNWRGQLQAVMFPMAARAADTVLKRYTFEVDASSANPRHCLKYNNRIVVRSVNP